jgi:hypothetical protein
MSHLRSRTGLLVVGVGALLGFLVLPVHPVAQANPIAIVTFDIDTAIVPGQGWAVPPDGSNWHELFPNFCSTHHQLRYDDNDHNGLVSVGDNIVEEGGSDCWQIGRVMTTYYFSGMSMGGSYIAEPSTTSPGSSPICDQWRIIQSDGPDFARDQIVHVQDWYDANHNGQFDVCDPILLNGQWYHVDRIGCGVTVTFNPVTGVKSGTWGWLKSMFHR